MNTWDILLIAALAGLLALALRRTLRARKAGGCCGGCQGCAYRGACHGGKERA